MYTFALLREKKVGLSSGRQIGDTITCIKENGALFIRQRCVWLDFQGLVMAEVAGES
jgi:hypothetical protein